MDVGAVVAAYGSAWNEPDEAARRRLLESAWADDATYCDPTANIEGREALIAHIGALQVAMPGHTIDVVTAADEHDGHLRFGWVMHGPDGWRYSKAWTTDIWRTTGGFSRSSASSGRSHPWTRHEYRTAGRCDHRIRHRRECACGGPGERRRPGLLLERTEQFVDHVRGEYMHPWGVAEAMQLGLYDDLIKAGGNVISRFVGYDEVYSPAEAEATTMPLADLVPGVPGALGIGHPVTCQILFDAAVRAGARGHSAASSRSR